MSSNKKFIGKFHQHIGSGGRESISLKDKEELDHSKKVSNPLHAPRTDHAGTCSIKRSNL